jgi:hypothetical protein
MADFLLDWDRVNHRGKQAAKRSSHDRSPVSGSMALTVRAAASWCLDNAMTIIIP